MTQFSATGTLELDSVELTSGGLDDLQAELASVGPTNIGSSVSGATNVSSGGSVAVGGSEVTSVLTDQLAVQEDIFDELSNPSGAGIGSGGMASSLKGALGSIPVAALVASGATVTAGALIAVPATILAKDLVTDPASISASQLIVSGASISAGALIASSATVTSSALVAKAATVLPSSLVAAGAVIPPVALIAGAATISAGVLIAGRADVTAAALVGSAAVITAGALVGSAAVVGAGAVVAAGAVISAADLIAEKAGVDDVVISGPDVSNTSPTPASESSLSDTILDTLTASFGGIGIGLGGGDEDRLGDATATYPHEERRNPEDRFTNVGGDSGTTPDVELDAPIGPINITVERGDIERQLNRRLAQLKAEILQQVSNASTTNSISRSQQKQFQRQA